MSVSVAPARGRKAVADLNLVPFIDLLSVMIHALDLATGHDYDRAVLGGGPAE